MNATRKAGTKRAVFAIEDAIADTRKRIASSAKELQRKALANLGPSLATEKEGRLFAVAALERLRNADADKASVYPYVSEYTEGDEIKPFRKGPQWDGFAKDLAQLQDATEEARNGFASIFTEALAGDVGGSPDYFRRLEREGKLLPFGTPGTQYEAPKPKAPTKAQRKAVAKAQGPRLVKGEAEAIEQFLQHSGPARRAAMVFLSKPYAEMAAAIKSDKRAAEAFAKLAIGLDEVKENYLTIALQISRASGEIKRALSERTGAKQQARNKRQRAK